MINRENMNAGDAFAGAFQTACMTVTRDRPNFRFYEVHGLNPNTVFTLANGDMEMVIDTKLRRRAVQQTLFGINAAEWFAWQQPDRDHLPVVQIGWDADGEAVRQNREWRPMGRVAILGYASYQPAGQRLIAQWIDQIEVAFVGQEFVDTQLATYSTLSTVLQEGIRVEQELADEIERLTRANALANPCLNPNEP